MVKNQPEVLWEQALAQLALRMGRATFCNWLQYTRLAAVEAGEYVVETESEPGREWLDKRLRPVIEQTLADLVGQPVGVRFVVDYGGPPAPQRKEISATQGGEAPTLIKGKESAGQENGPGEVALADLPLAAWVDAPTGDFIRQVDFPILWQKTGFTAMPDYAIRYWRLYLGRAFDLWELLVSEDKRDVKLMRQGSLPYWTPVRQYSYRTLARLLGCSRNTITGHFQPCWSFRYQRQTARAKGVSEAEVICCGRFNPGPAHPERCVYWCEGMLERLYREGLVAVARVATPGKPRSHVLRLQAWRLLPILTPTQVASFKEALDQENHRQWVERYGHLGGFNPAHWEQIEVPSLVPFLSGYGWGRELFEPYCNNPLEMGRQ